MGGKATKNERKVSRAAIAAAFQELDSKLKHFCERTMLCGSYRRGKDLIGDMDVVVIPIHALDLVLPPEATALKEQIFANNKRTSIVLPTPEGDVQCDVYVSTHEEWGAQILTWTGSAAHNIYLRSAAKKLGWLLNQYGLWDSNGNRLDNGTEKSIFSKIGWRYLEPNERNKEFKS